MKQKTLLIVSATLLILAFIGGALIYEAKRSEEAARAAQHNLSFLVRMHSPTQGKASAKVHIVEFFDPACGTCKAFYPFVKKLMAANPDKIKLSVRYAPFHDGSDIVVKMLEAARKQGKFWEAMEAVLATQEIWTRNHGAQPQLVLNSLGGIGLNLERLQQDMNAPEIGTLIAQDMADGRALNVKATPEFFVNGRPMPSFGYEQLKDLVETALADAYR